MKMEEGASRFRSQEEAVVKFLQARNHEKTVLLIGSKKSGNTWLRFIIYNYFRVLLNRAEATLTYKELNQLQRHTLESGCVEGAFPEGYPQLVRTHDMFSGLLSHFHKVLYIYRNPLDTLISFCYYMANMKEPLFMRCMDEVRQADFETKFLAVTNQYVLAKLPETVNAHIHVRDHANVIVSYEDMRIDCTTEMHRIFTELEWKVDEGALEKSIQMSSFENIHRMEKMTGQNNGNHSKEFPGPFTRSGQTGQYLSILAPETVVAARKYLQTQRVPELSYMLSGVEPSLA